MRLSYERWHSTYEIQRQTVQSNCRTVTHSSRGKDFYLPLGLSQVPATLLPRELCVPGYLSQNSDLLRVRRSGDRNPVEARFSKPVQTGPVAHPDYYTMCTGSPSRG